MILQRVLLQSCLFTLAYGYYHYSTIDKLTGIKYECIDGYLDADFYKNLFLEESIKYDRPIEQIIPYCLAVDTVTSDRELCIANGGVSWSFERLEQFNITTADLLQWNAQVNLVDEYGYYLQTHPDQLKFSRFCNCSNAFYFGRDCQYTFDLKHSSFVTILQSHFFNLQSIDTNDHPTMTEASLTCYRRDSSCYGACLDWRQICNGIGDCEDGQDERHCELLEFNKCGNDQYRCRSGHCIPIQFAFDMSFDCADGSDETNSFLDKVKLFFCYRKVPNMFCDEWNDAWMRFPCGEGQSFSSLFHSCPNGRTFRMINHLYATDNTLCFRYMQCTQRSNFYFPSTADYNELCGEHDNYSSMLSSVCPESTVMFPAGPILLAPSVYLVYQTNKSEHLLPDFICYTQCDHLYPPTSQHHGYSCRSIDELSYAPLNVSHHLLSVVTDLIYLFAGCLNDASKINGSIVYHCPLTKQAIPYYRTNDGYDDCFSRSDETFHDSNCIAHSKQQFQCWTQSDKCIPLRLVQDGRIHCSDHSDEFFGSECVYGTEWECDYQRGLHQLATIHYRFSVINCA